MKAIYEPKGKAREYSGLACNLYRGCGHRCTYCYAPGVLRMDREEFYNDPQPRKGIIEALRKDAKVIGDKYKRQYKTWESAVENHAATILSKPIRPEVFLCFTSDPYQPINKEHQLTRQAIEILHENEIIVNILTKGRVTDWDLLAKRPDLSKIGVTLTHHSKQSPWVDDYEPCAPSNYFRIWNLKRAHDKGITTWVSLEPIVHGSNVLEIIKDTYSFVGEFKLDKWNYDKRANDIDWYKFTNEAVKLLEKLGCKYQVKDDLKKYLKESK